MKNYNELLTESNRNIVAEQAAAELLERNEIHFRTWAKRWYIKTNHLPINRSSKIEELYGRLDCANGRPSTGKSKSYLEGYAAEYAENEQTTAQQEAF